MRASVELRLALDAPSFASVGAVVDRLVAAARESEGDDALGVGDVRLAPHGVDLGRDCGAALGTWVDLPGDDLPDGADGEQSEVDYLRGQVHALRAAQQERASMRRAE